MNKHDMDKVFQGFFGDSIAKADAVITEARVKKEETKKVNLNQDLGLDKIYNDFFGDVMKRTEKF